VHTMIFMGFMPLGQMLLGSVGTVLGIDRAFVIGGIIVMAIAFFAATRAPALRDATAAPQAGLAARSG